MSRVAKIRMYLIYPFIMFKSLLGVLLMTASETEDSDILWCINHDSFPFKKPLMETQVTCLSKQHMELC